MAYTFPWDETFPPGTQSADQINEDLQRILVQTRERLVDLFGITFPNDTVTTVTATKVVLKGSATSKIIPGATSLALRNNADSADNVLVNDPGDVIIRNSLVTKGNIGGRFISVDDTSDVAQFQITISGSGGLQVKPASTATIKHLFLLDSTSSTKVDIDFQSGASTWAGGLTINAGGLIIGAGGLTVTAGGATIGGNSSIVGTLLINGGAGASSLELRGAAANKRSLFYTTAGSVRWEAFTDQNAESGSNNGSNFQLSRYDDSGTFIDNALSIFRSSGAVLFTSTAQSRFQLKAIPNGGMVSALDIHASSLGVPGTYNRAGGLELQFTAGVITQFGIFSDAVDLEIKSTNTSNTINILNKVSLNTTGVASGTSILDINKDNGASTALYIKINRAGSTKWYIGLDSADNFVIYQNDGSTQALRVGTGGSVVIGNQSGLFPSATLTDGSNQLDIGWNTNTFYFKQSVGTQRTINFRTSGNVDVLAIDLSAQKVTAVGVLDVGTGYRIGNAAASGAFLRGNGTNFVSNTIQATDLPTFTGIFGVGPYFSTGSLINGSSSSFLTLCGNAAGIGHFIATRAGEVRGISIRSTNPRTAGSVTATASKNGTNGAVSVTIDATHTQIFQATVAAGTMTFAAGDDIGVNWASTSFGPASDISVYLDIIYTA